MKRKKIQYFITLSICAFTLMSCTTTTLIDGKPAPNKPKAPSVSKASELDQLPELAQLNYSMGIGYIRKGRMEAAEQKLKAVTELAPNFPDAYNALGVLEEERGRTDLAREYFAKALAVNPSYEQAASNFTRLQCRSGASIESAGIKTNATGKAGLYAGAAQCALDSNNIANAQSYVQQAIATDPSYPYSYFVRAKIEAKNNNSAAAFSSLDQYHNLEGYTSSSVSFALALAMQSGNTAMMNKYQRIQNTQFK